MEQENDFNGLEPAEPPAYLFRRVIRHIRIDKKLRESQKRIAYFSMAFLGSVAAFLATFLSLEGALVESGILKIISVVAADPATAAIHWQDFSLFFLESIPVFYIAAFLVSLFAFLELLKYTSKSARSMISALKTANAGAKS